MISLTVNGELRQCSQPIKLDQLIESLALEGRRFAVEKNGDIVPRSRFAEEILVDGDRLEIVIAVGGG
ncbi:MAG TPA: sulfur carrier protein ThiS [Burkholderiales bacterium]|nr:sulfur carrier protein ThiS [Burkholderiales bacterium]